MRELSERVKNVAAEKLSRFGVTVPEDMLKEFDLRLQTTGKYNRSDVIRQLMRRFVTEGRWQEESGQVYGSVTLMYDHHSSSVSKDLTAAQHVHGETIVCTTHAHIDHDTCLECIVLRGDASRIRAFVESLGKIKGIKSIDTVIASGP